MKEKIKDFFKSQGIEYYAALDYKDVRETEGEIIAREDFTPRSLIIYLIPYYAGKCDNLSVYAGSLDYHIFLRELGTQLKEVLLREYEGARVKSYGDHSPIDERHAAVIGGLGVLGKNGLILNSSYGSYVFVGEVITDIDPTLLGAVSPRALSFCHGCGACLKACPTGALCCRGECLSAITQKKGELAESEADLIKKFNTVWGCDICQAVCPYNREPRLTPIDFFYKDRISHLDTAYLNSLSKQEFTNRAFAWRGRKTVLRNLQIYENKK